MNIRSMSLAVVQTSAILLALVLASHSAASAPPMAPMLLCSNGDTDCRTTGSGSERVKWNPGHYMHPYVGTNQATRFRHYDEIAANRAIQGVVFIGLWGRLEPQRGVYDFSEIRAELEKLASLTVPKRLFIRMFTMKTSSASGCSSEYFPTYILNMEGCVSTSTYHHTLRWWDSEVVDRYIALLEALGDEFDAHPLFEGIVLNRESALGPAHTISGFSVSSYQRQSRRLMTASKAAFPRSNVVFYTNFVSGGAGQSTVTDWIAWQRNNGIGQGTPDLAPDCVVRDLTCSAGFNDPQGNVGGGPGFAYNATKGNHAGGGISSIGEIPIVWAVEESQLGNDRIGQKGGYHPETLLEFCEGWALGCTHLLWRRAVNDNGVPEQKWPTGILPLINANPNLSNSRCPVSHLARGGCITGQH
jgi:hypothetical protein